MVSGSIQWVHLWSHSTLVTKGTWLMRFETWQYCSLLTTHFWIIYLYHLDQLQANYHTLQTKPSLLLLLEIKFYLNTPCPLLYLLSVVAFVLQWQSCVLVTRLVWLPTSKIFTAYPFMGKGFWCLKQITQLKIKQCSYLTSLSHGRKTNSDSFLFNCWCFNFYCFYYVQKLGIGLCFQLIYLNIWEHFPLKILPLVVLSV